MFPITLEDGRKLVLSPGKHNEVQRAVIEEFAPRYAKGAILLYVGDTEKKDLFIYKKRLKEIGIPIGKHSKLPDVVLYQPDNKWIYLIEAVTSHGPISPKRMVELEELLTNCDLGKIYVTAFPDITEFKKHTKNIAWETEVWIVEFPDYLSAHKITTADMQSRCTAVAAGALAGGGVSFVSGWVVCALG